MSELKMDGDSRTLQDHAVCMLRLMVATGELQSGKVYTEQHLAGLLEKRLGTKVSRTPVGMAVSALAQEGLVAPELLKGVRIKSRPILEASKILSLRECVDLFVTLQLAREVAAAPNSIDLSRLEEIVCQQQAALDRDDETVFLTLGGKFHLLVAELAGFAAVEDVLRSLWARSSMAFANRASRPRLTQHADLEDICREHALILAALRKGEEDARAAVEHHFAMQRRRTGVANALVLTPQRAFRAPKANLPELSDLTPAPPVLPCP